MKKIGLAFLIVVIVLVLAWQLVLMDQRAEDAARASHEDYLTEKYQWSLTETRTP